MADTHRGSSANCLPSPLLKRICCCCRRHRAQTVSNVDVLDRDEDFHSVRPQDRDTEDVALKRPEKGEFIFGEIDSFNQINCVYQKEN